MSTSKIRSAVIGGTVFSPRKFKAHIIEKIKSGGISGKKLEEMLKDEGMDKSQLKKRRRLIAALTGRDVEKLSKKEERKIAERVKMRIAAARRSSEMMGGGADGDEGMSVRRTSRSSEDRARNAAESLKARKLDKAGTSNNSVQSNAGIGGPAPMTGGTSAAPPISFNKMG